MENFDTKRIKLVINLVVITSLVFAYNLFNKQVLEYSNYSAQAHNQYDLEKDLPARRGTINLTSRDDEKYPIAISMQKYQVIVIPKNIKNKDKVAEIISGHLAVSKEEIFTKINNDKPYIPPVARKIDREVAKKIADENLIGVLISPELDRVYPENELGAQIVGFLNSENEGMYGLEGYYQTDLQGLQGWLEAEKDTQGRIIKLSSQIDPKDGLDLNLSIDRNIQYFVEKSLKEAVVEYKAESGSIIIMNVKTGEIVAMANTPSFNPNTYNQIPTEQNYLFKNSAIANTWEPGSIFKPFTMGLALEKKLVEPNTEEVFPASVKVQSYTINTATKKAYGRETMTQVLENSDNVAMVWVGDKIGNQSMYDFLEGVGMKQKTAIDLDTESVGNFPIFRDWRDVTRATISFGQGIATTPIKILQLYAGIANGGKLLQPRIVHSVEDSSGHEQEIKTVESGLLFSAETCAKLNQMLISVVKNGHGKRAGVSGYLVAGKTGTAQIPNPDGKGYLEKDHIGSFAGYFPADNPQYAMLVKLDKPQSVEFAESSAAPTFGKIAAWLLSYKGILPNQK